MTIGIGYASPLSACSKVGTPLVTPPWAPECAFLICERLSAWIRYFFDLTASIYSSEFNGTCNSLRSKMVCWQAPILKLVSQGNLNNFAFKIAYANFEPAQIISV